MSGHTNRNRRNGGNPKSRHGPQRQRGSDGRSGQAKNGVQPSSAPESPASERQPDEETQHRLSASQPPAKAEPPTEAPDAQQAPIADDAISSEESKTPAGGQESANPRGRAPFAAASRGSQAYIPASGPRLGMIGHNGQNGQNGQNGYQSPNGHAPARRRMEMPVSASDDDDGESDSTAPIPQTWRIERLNGGTDVMPREPFRPESRGEVGSLIDSLHEMFAQDRSVASRGDSARCGICYLHFPLSALEYRETEGFYVCSGCKRSLGHQQLMMIRRQQTNSGG